MILCPGYGCSGVFLDFDDRHSLARYLARRGMDAWVLDLRGRGESRPVARPENQRSHWTFDDLVRYDVPAAIETVRSRTGRSQVAWIGHSLGGLAVYAFVGTTPIGREAVAAVVTLASPVLFPASAWRLFRRLGITLLSLPLPGTVPQREVVSFLWKAFELTGLIRVGMNPSNLDPHLAGRALRRSLHNVSLAKLRQLATWSSEQVFCSADRAVDYREGLRRFEVPILVAAGSDDHLAGLENVHLAMEEIASTDKTFVEFGEAQGHRANYGHVDLILGRHAPEEVFSRIATWLEQRLR